MESSWVIIVIGTVIATIASFVAYFCGCCKKLPRDEILGLSGIVKITNPDSVQNNAPVTISITRTPSEDNVPMSSVPSSNASTKRLNGVGNIVSNSGTATRSLPEIPVNVPISMSSNRNDENLSNFLVYSTGDTNSDLYATLDEPKIREHPYAQVDTPANAGTSRLEHNALDRRNNVAPDVIDGIPNIPAASAIAGSVAASNELPYMTPPIHTDHFSGDSQDSTKGYTSITVREPLAHIRSKTLTNQDTSDSHYTIFSDDSDEMYTAIQEPYTSGSETYAQIQPVTSNSTYSSVSNTFSEINMSQRFSNSSVHSRQASSSSVISVLTNRNSPKEKRQANSPLPKPPDVAPDDMYAKVLKKRKSDNDWCNSRDSVYHSDFPDSTTSLIFYQGPSGVPDLLTKQDQEFMNTDKANDEDDPDKYACGYETLPERKYELLNKVNQSSGYETVKESDQSAGYESLPEPDSLTPGYERIREPANYEKIKYDTKEDELDPNYEELKPQTREHFHCYATINKSSKVKFSENVSEPDYATLIRHGETMYDNEDLLYERVRQQVPTVDKEEGKLSDKNNNHSKEFANIESPQNHSVSETNLSDLYSKVHKNIKR